MPKSCMTRPSGGSARLRKNPSGCCFQSSLLSACSSHGSTRHVKNCMQTYDQKSPRALRLLAADRTVATTPSSCRSMVQDSGTGFTSPPRPDCPGGLNSVIQILASATLSMQDAVVGIPVLDGFHHSGRTDQLGDQPRGQSPNDPCVACSTEVLCCRL